MQVLILLKNGLVKLLEWTVILLMGVLVLDVLWGVFSRYVLGSQSRWTEELAIFLLVWVSLLGASVAYSARMHLGVDYFAGKLHPDAQKLMEVIVNLIVIAFAVLVFLGGGYVLVSETLAANQVSPALGIKNGYVYLAVPISGLFIVLFGIEAIFEVLTRKESVPPANKEI